MLSEPIQRDNTKDLSRADSTTANRKTPLFVPPCETTIHDDKTTDNRTNVQCEVSQEPSSYLVPPRPDAAGTNPSGTSSLVPSPYGEGRGPGTSKTTPLAPTSSPTSSQAHTTPRATNPREDYQR